MMLCATLTKAAPLDPWHYPRPELAEKYLQVFDIGLVAAQGLFAKRRMGKSEFLEQDLLPAARANGYLTAYVNLWDAREHPAPSLLAALTLAIEPKGFSKLVKTLNTPLKKIKASAKVSGLAEGSLEAELADNPSIAGPRLSELLRGFNKPRKRLLLVLDEAQVLAESLHTELAHSLRAGLDSRKQNIKVVFAGSSEPTLRRMFGRSTEPFYNWAPLEPFELLGAEFVKAMVVKVNSLSRFSLRLNEASAAYAALKHTPEFFRRYLTRYLTHAELGSKAALEDTLAHVFSDANFAPGFKRLLPADREVLRLLARGESDLFSERARRRLGLALGVDRPVTKSAPQHALKRLQDADLVIKLEHGLYQLQDDAFAEWLRNLELDL
jgi:hypothetical protein